MMTIAIFGTMGAAILYLLYDNMKQEKMINSLVDKVKKEKARREVLELMHFGEIIESDELIFGVERIEDNE